jgi:hypothetical protein
MLALLTALKTAVQDFARREERLNGGHRSKITAENKSYETAATTHARHASEALAATKIELQDGKARTQVHFEKRKRWINQAHFNSRQRAMDQIRQQEAHARYRVQEGSVGAERHRDAELTRAATAHQEMHQNLQQTRQAFATLEASARSVFLGYGAFGKLLSPSRVSPGLEPSTDPQRLFAELDSLRDKTEGRLQSFRKRTLTAVFRFLPVWLQVLLLLVVAGFASFPAAFPQVSEPARKEAALGFLALWAALVALRWWTQHQARPAADEIASALVKARSLQNACFGNIDLHFQNEQKRIHAESDAATQQLNQDWKDASKAALKLLDERPREIDDQAPLVARKNDELHARKLAEIERRHTDRTRQARLQAEAETAALIAAHQSRVAALNAEHEAAWKDLESEWAQQIHPLYETIAKANATSAQLFPDWESPDWAGWKPPQEFTNAAKFGRLDIDITRFFESVPKDRRLALPGSGALTVPMLLSYPQDGSIVFETTGTGTDVVMGTINDIIFRLLSTTPPGKLSFTIFDPVGLGQNFAGLMHLADYEESHINSRIWTQAGQLEEKLAELNEHMEKVIQMYLRNEYETIAEYNAHAGSIAEKYHFLVVADFPVNFSETAARRLINIATSGARCGVYTLIHWDRRHALPQGFVAEELRKNNTRVVRLVNEFELDHQPPGARLALDPPPSPEFATRFLHEVGQLSKDTNRVEVPFVQVAPPDSEMWSEETTDELQVPIGRSGATKLQYLEIGKATRQHALLAGKTGSGKSTLFHVIITNLSLWCSPEQVEFYLVDFKKGVEFKCYANRRLPHAKVVAIESDREFGLSVLQRVDEELRRRGDLFRQLSVQDLPGYKKAGGTEPMPRSLLIIDEFQEFFVEEDRVSQYAAVLLDRIVRQGRAFGIHVLLGSQTLGGAYTLARATIGQMVIRIALQCNEADAYLIMDQDNPAPRLLSRPGEGIYNDAAGAIEGNSPFQTVWLPEQERDVYLEKIRKRADSKPNPPPGPFVFEGNAAADVKENGELKQALQTPALAAPSQARVWLGAPNSIKGPTKAVFRRQSSNNLLIVGQGEERALTMISVALVSLAAQYPKDAARFVLLDSTPAGFPQRELLQRVIGAIPHEVEQVNNATLPKVLSGIADRLGQPEEEREAGDTFVFIHGLQNYKKLRAEDEFSFSSAESASSPAAALLRLLNEGPSRGFHTMVTCDSYTNVNRFLGRKGLTDFEMRVLFQMSASDSASLIDSPDASTLGLNRAIYYNDREGYTETFRPYALPGNDWIEEVIQRLARVQAEVKSSSPKDR